MNNYKYATNGGELTEFCIIEHFQNIVAIGVRYLPDFGMHYIITSPIIAHVNEHQTIKTWDKHYKLVTLITYDADVAFYQNYFEKTVSQDLWFTEIILATEFKTVN